MKKKNYIDNPQEYFIQEDKSSYFDVEEGFRKLSEEENLVYHKPSKKEVFHRRLKLGLIYATAGIAIFTAAFFSGAAIARATKDSIHRKGLEGFDYSVEVRNISLKSDDGQKNTFSAYFCEKESLPKFVFVFRRGVGLPLIVTIKGQGYVASKANEVIVADLDNFDEFEYYFTFNGVKFTEKVNPQSYHDIYASKEVNK